MDLIAAGTRAATAGLAPLLEDGAAGVDEEVDDDAELALDDALLLLLLLLPHAAMAAALSSDTAASAGFLKITNATPSRFRPQ